MIIRNPVGEFKRIETNLIAILFGWNSNSSWNSSSPNLLANSNEYVRLTFKFVEFQILCIKNDESGDFPEARVVTVASLLFYSQFDRKVRVFNLIFDH